MNSNRRPEKNSHNIYLMKDLYTKYCRVLITLNNTMLNKVIFKIDNGQRL